MHPCCWLICSIDRLLYSTAWLCHNAFTHATTDRHTGCLRVCAILDEAAVSSLLCIFLWGASTHFPWICSQEKNYWIISPWLALGDTANAFSNFGWIDTPTSYMRVLVASHLTNTCVCHFSECQPSWWNKAPHFDATDTVLLWRNTKPHREHHMWKPDRSLHVRKTISKRQLSPGAGRSLAASLAVVFTSCIH